MEYSVRVPKNSQKPISVMRFNGALDVDPAKWTSLKMKREDPSKPHKTPVIQQDDNMPKFGAGSEYGRRRTSGGGNKRKFNLEEQPWIMKTSKKNKKYRGVKEGGVSQNASYYIFTQAADGAFEVVPVDHWYNFTPIQRYKSLTAEEAEEQFGRRNKIHNYFSVMVRKRLKADDDNDGEKLSAGKSSKKASSGLKVNEMDDWDDSESEVEGSEEGRELDYISDTTESEEEKEEKNAEVGVDQEQELLDSESDEEGEKPDRKMIHWKMRKEKR